MVGGAAAIIAPVEIHTFTLFSEGGKFHYEGFGFGSFMFANIAIQVAGYYAIAFVCIPLGYGHLKLQPWSGKVTLTLLWDWMILGFPLSIILFLMLLSSKDLPQSSLPFLVLGFILAYPVLPILFIRLYRHRHMRLSFQEQSAGSDWSAQFSISDLILINLVIFIILALHVPLLFNGIFPLFTKFAYGLQGFLLLDFSILFQTCMLWGLVKGKKWAWWGTLVYMLLLTISATISFLSTEPMAILANMRFPESELEILQNVPVQGYHLALMINLPLWITVLFQVLSRKDYHTRDLKENDALLIQS
jgi:hypothetical protein